MDIFRPPNGQEAKQGQGRKPTFQSPTVSSRIHLDSDIIHSNSTPDQTIIQWRILHALCSVSVPFTDQSFAQMTQDGSNGSPIQTCTARLIKMWSTHTRRCTTCQTNNKSEFQSCVNPCGYLEWINSRIAHHLAQIPWRQRRKFTESRSRSCYMGLSVTSCQLRKVELKKTKRNVRIKRKKGVRNWITVHYLIWRDKSEQTCL